MGECLDYALQFREIHVIWDGTGKVERQRTIGLFS